MIDVWAGTAYGLAELGSLKGDGVGGLRQQASSGEHAVKGHYPFPENERTCVPAVTEGFTPTPKTSGMLIEELINAVVRAEERAEK